jgi:hypothetical protein
LRAVDSLRLLNRLSIVCWAAVIHRDSGEKANRSAKSRCLFELVCAESGAKRMIRWAAERGTRAARANQADPPTQSTQHTTIRDPVKRFKSKQTNERAKERERKQNGGSV